MFKFIKKVTKTIIFLFIVVVAIGALLHFLQGKGTDTDEEVFEDDEAKSADNTLGYCKLGFSFAKNKFNSAKDSVYRFYEQTYVPIVRRKE